MRLERIARRAKKFFKTPKGLLTMILAALIVVAAPGQGIRAVATALACAIIAAGLVGRPDSSSKEENLGVSQRRRAHGHDRHHGAARSGAVVRGHHHLGCRGSQQVRRPLARRPTFSIPRLWRLSPVSMCSIPARAGGAP